MHFYDEWAQRIARGELTDHRAFYGLPLYPYLLALLYSAFGHDPFAPAFLQICCDSGTAALIYAISLRLFGGPAAANGFVRADTERHTSDYVRASTIGLLSAGAWAFFAPAQAYSVILMPTVLGTFAFWLVVAQLAKRPTAPELGACLGLGLAIGFFAMGVATITSLVPLVVAALFLKPATTARGMFRNSRLSAVTMFVAGLAVGSAPCWIHNSVIARDPVMLSAHGGVNLWIGNNAQATGYPHFPGLRAGQAEMLRDSVSIAEAAAGRPLKRSEVSAYWSSKARDYIIASPVKWMQLVATKIANFWNAFEYDDLGIINKLCAEGVILPGPRFGLIAAFAIPGLLFAVRSISSSRWIAAAIMLQMVAVIPVFVTERYRIAVVPGLCVFAAFGLVALWQWCAAFDIRRLALYMILLTGAAAFVSLPRDDPALWALQAYNAGREAQERGDVLRAEGELQRARAYSPANAEVSLALGNLRLAQGDPKGAASYYNATLAVDSRHKRALNNLGVIALQNGAPQEAEGLLRRALEQEPDSAPTRYLLAKSLMQQRRFSDAKRELERVLVASPETSEFQQLRREIEAAVAADATPSD